MLNLYFWKAKSSDLSQIHYISKQKIEILETFCLYTVLFISN